MTDNTFTLSIFGLYRLCVDNLVAELVMLKG